MQWHRYVAKSTVGVGVVVAVIVLANCRSESITRAGVGDDPLIDRIVSMGFRRETIVDKGDYFLVEGDIRISKQSLEAPPQPPDSTRRWRFPSPSRQYSSNNLVSQAVVHNIVIDISGAETAWQTALRDAIAEWNSITPGAQVHFVEGSPGQITVSMQSLGTCIGQPYVIGSTDFPTSAGQPGPTLRINSQSSSCVTATRKKYAMAHELGHALGLRHTDWQHCDPPDDNGTGANHIVGTPFDADDPSVMNACPGARDWNGFSTYDKLAAFELYPPPMPTLTVSYPNGVPTFTWSALPDGPQYRVSLSEYYSFWYEPMQDYESTSSTYPGDWTTTTSTTHSGSYTGVSECHVGSREPGAYDLVDSWILQVRYPITDLYTDPMPAEIVTCY